MTNPYHHAIEILGQALAMKQPQADDYVALAAGNSPEHLQAIRRAALLNEQIEHIQNAMVLLQTAPLPAAPTGDSHVG
jgi:hypothetical protein